MIPFITIGDSTYTANSATQIIIGGQTLTPGGQITAGGNTISLDSDGDTAVVDGTTQAVGHAAPEDTPITSAPKNPATVLTLGGSTITANSNSQFIIDGQTLTPGGAITVSGTPISLGSDASKAVIGTTTESLDVLPPSAGPVFTPGQPTPTSGGPDIPGSKPTITSKPNYPKTPDVPDGKKSYEYCDAPAAKCSDWAETAFTLEGYTTIPSATKHSGSRPTSGLAAFHALAPFAQHALGSVHSAFSSLQGLGQNPSSQDFSNIGSAFGSAISGTYGPSRQGTIQTSSPDYHSVHYV